MKSSKKYLLLISIHGLIRAHDLELGRDADTGGQTKYVVDLARALASCEGVAQVDLVTRRLVDHAVDAEYAEGLSAFPIKRASSALMPGRRATWPRKCFGTFWTFF